jgi:transcriptional regulator with XRE-family HTH domain
MKKKSERKYSGVFGRIMEALGSEGKGGIAKAACALGFTVQALYKWEKGDGISIDTLMTISEVSGASIDWLLTGEQPMYVKERRKAYVDGLGYVDGFGYVRAIGY